MTTDIDLAVENHLPNVYPRIFEDFTVRTNNHIASISSKNGVLAKEYEKKIAYNSLLATLIDQQYMGLLYETTEKVKAIFERHGLLFRLYDIHRVIHGYHRLSLIWFVGSKEIVFDFLFDSSTEEPFDSFFRLVELNSSGNITNGDTITGKVNILDEDPDFPSWFYSAIRRNS